MSDITITPPKNFMDSWHASRPVPADWERVARQLVTHIEGGAEGHPPFIRARGRTPAEAVTNLYTAIGESWLAYMAAQEFEVLPGSREPA